MNFLLRLVPMEMILLSENISLMLLLSILLLFLCLILMSLRESKHTGKDFDQMLTIAKRNENGMIMKRNL